MFGEYSENQIAADGKYRGRIFFVRGAPAKIGYDNEGKIYVVLAYSPGRVADCLFEDDQKEEVSELKVTGRWNPTIVIKGKSEGVKGGGYEGNNGEILSLTLTECSIVKDEPSVIQISELTDGGAGPTKYICLAKGDPGYDKEWHDVSSDIYNSMDECIAHGGEPLVEEDLD